MSGCYRSVRPAELNLRILFHTVCLILQGKLQQCSVIIRLIPDERFSVGRLNGCRSFVQVDRELTSLWRCGTELPLDVWAEGIMQSRGRYLSLLLAGGVV
jgi:hypothetical protein